MSLMPSKMGTETLRWILIQLIKSNIKMSVNWKKKRPPIYVGLSYDYVNIMPTKPGHSRTQTIRCNRYSCLKEGFYLSTFISLMRISLMMQSPSYTTGVLLTSNTNKYRFQKKGAFIITMRLWELNMAMNRARQCKYQ